MWAPSAAVRQLLIAIMARRRAMPVTERRTEVAKHIRHFQLLTGHSPRPSDESRKVELFQWTDRGTEPVVGAHQIQGRGGQFAVPKQQLGGAYVGDCFQQMDGERMA